MKIISGPVWPLWPEKRPGSSSRVWLLAGLVLLFANAFGAYATAWTLGGSNIALVTIQIAFTITGEVLHDPGAGDALAMLSLAVMSACIAVYHLANSRARRWVR